MASSLLCVSMVGHRQAQQCSRVMRDLDGNVLSLVLLTFYSDVSVVYLYGSILSSGIFVFIEGYEAERVV